MIYLRSRLGTATGIGFIDSTSLKVCHNRRIFSHRVFKNIARRGKTSVDWFAACEAGKRRRRDLGAHALRFKLHLAINDRGELLNIALTPGNVDDRKPVEELLKEHSGKFYGERTRPRPVPCVARSDAYGIAVISQKLWLLNYVLVVFYLLPSLKRK